MRLTLLAFAEDVVRALEQSIELDVRGIVMQRPVQVPQIVGRGVWRRRREVAAACTGVEAGGLEGRRAGRRAAGLCWRGGAGRCDGVDGEHGVRRSLSSSSSSSMVSRTETHAD